MMDDNADSVIRCPNCGHITNIEFFEIEIEDNCPGCGKHKFKDFNIITENGETDTTYSENHERKTKEKNGNKSKAIEKIG